MGCGRHVRMPRCSSGLRWLSSMPGLRELRSSNDLLLAGSDSTTLLQSRLAEDGYLLFRNMLPRPQVLALRKRIAGALHDLRWINALQPSPHANGDGDAEDYAGTLVSTPPVETLGVDPHDWPIFDRVQLMEEFHALPHAHALLSTLTHVMGERVLMHPRHICRVHFPNQDENRTLPHQDYPYVQGSNRFVTNWCPLGDVPASMGPLAILVGSHHYGMRSLVRSNNGQMMVDVAELLPRCWWGTTDFRAGDVLTFSAFTVHMGLDNTSDQVRLSLDCRAQPLSEQVSARALTPNWDRQSWDYIYSKWQDHDSAAEHRNGSDGAKGGFGREAQVETLKFYWERLPLNIAQETEFDANAFLATFDPLDY